MNTRNILLAFLAITSFFSLRADAQEFMKDSTYYRVINGKAAVCYTNKYSAVIPATVSYSGRTYAVNGIAMPEHDWTPWRGIGDNVRTLTIPVTCDTIYSPQPDDLYEFTFPGGKNLSGVTVAAPVSGKRHFLPCTSAQSTLQPYMPFGILAYQKHAYTGSMDTIYVLNVPPVNERTKSTGICYVGTNSSTPTVIKSGALHHLHCNTLCLATNVRTVYGIGLYVDPQWQTTHDYCSPENYTPGQCSFKNIKFFTMLRSMGTSLSRPFFTGSSSYLSVDNGVALYTKDYTGLMAYAPGSTDTTYTVDSRCRAVLTSAFTGNVHLKSVVLPEGLETIGNQAFRATPSLRTVNIPSTLTRLGFQAFCYSGISGTVDLSRCPDLGSNVFASCKNVTKIIFSSDTRDYEAGLPHTIPENFITQYYVGPLSADSIDGRGSLTEIVIPEGIETIGRYAFEGNRIKSLKLPSTLKTVKDEAFWYNSITGNLDLSNVTALGYAAFMHNAITQLTFPTSSSFTLIPDYCFAFNDIRTLTGGKPFVISVPTVGKAAFVKNNLFFVASTARLESIGDYAFACQQGTLPMTVLLQMSSKLSNIGNSAFTNALRFTVSESSRFAVDRYGDLMTKNGARLICLSHASDDPSLINNKVGTPYYYSTALSFYHKGEDRILPSTITTIDDLALYYNDLDRIVLPTGLTNMPFINSRSLSEMTITDKLMTSIADKSRGDNTPTVFIPGMTRQDYSMDLEVGSAADAHVGTNDAPQATLNVISTHSSDIEDWATAIVNGGYTGQILTNDSICLGWNAGKRGKQHHEVAFGTSTYKTFAADYPVVFDDPVVHIITKVDMDKAIVYTRKLPAAADGKYHVPARTGYNEDTYHGVILRKQGSKSTYSYRIDGNGNNQAVLYADNILNAAPVCQWLDIPSDKILLVLNGGVFKIVDNGGLIPAGKSYLYADKPATGTARFSFTLQEEDEDPSTGIQSVDTATADCSHAPYYTIMGQRVARPQSGNLYIHNHKKVIYK